MSNIPDQVRQVIAREAGVALSKVTDGARLDGDFKLDSMDTVELIMVLEQEFGCEFSDDAAAGILTVGDAIAFVSEHATIELGTPGFRLGAPPPPLVRPS